ncbi:MAG: hypothetical protein ABFR05_00210 [Bacteroidota bacterium]
MINNIEYGVHFTRNILNPTDKLFDETKEFTDELILEKSEVVFVKKPQYKKKIFGLTKSYQDSTVLFDISDDFFRGRRYEVKYLKEFDYEDSTDVDKLYETKPQRGSVDLNWNKRKNGARNVSIKHGYCIRTGGQIPFNPQRPYSYDAYKTWSQFENPDYEENYCHRTGRKSNGKTSMRQPVLY